MGASDGFSLRKRFIDSMPDRRILAQPALSIQHHETRIM
jgi:hypothetical protein